MNNKKKAFTLVEILLVLVLTAFIAVLANRTLNSIQDNYKPLYHSAYINLKHAVGEIIASDPDSKLDGDLCEPLAKQYTIIEGVNKCYDNYDFSPSTTFSYSTPDLEVPSFVLGNGQRYYVGSSFKSVGTFNYFDKPATLVMIDLNGKANPNVYDTRTYAGNRTPDVVAFAVLEDGTVLPMSPMADKESYITADIQLFNKATGWPVGYNGEPIPNQKGLASELENYGVIFKNIPIRQALSVSGQFPVNTGSDLTVQYNTDDTYAFNKTYVVDPRCIDTAATYCRVILRNSMAAGLGLGS